MHASILKARELKQAVEKSHKARELVTHYQNLIIHEIVIVRWHERRPSRILPLGEEFSFKFSEKRLD
jgi:hypothetical protein